MDNASIVLSSACPSADEGLNYLANIDKYSVRKHFQAPAIKKFPGFEKKGKALFNQKIVI